MKNEFSSLSQKYDTLMSLIEELNNNDSIADKAFVFTVNTNTNVITAPGCNYKDGWNVVISSSGTLPVGLSSSELYQIIAIDKDNFKIVDSSGNNVDINSNGSGTHTVKLYLTPEQLIHFADSKKDDIAATRNKINKLYQNVKYIGSQLNNINSLPEDILFTKPNITKETSLSARIWTDNEIAVNDLNNAYLMASYEIFTEDIYTVDYKRTFRWVDTWCKIGTTPFGSDVWGDSNDPAGWTITTEMANQDGSEALTQAEKDAVNNAVYADTGPHPFIVWKGRVEYGQTYYFSLRVFDAAENIIEVCSDGLTIVEPTELHAFFSPTTSDVNTKIIIDSTYPQPIGFYIERSEGYNYPHHPYERIATLEINSEATREFVDLDTERGVMYQYRIRPFEFVDGELRLHPYSDFINFSGVTLPATNAVVQYIDATVLSSRQIIIDWKRADRVSAATNLFRMTKQANNSWTSTQLYLKAPTAIPSPNDPNFYIEFFSDDGLAANTVYKYRIQYVGSSQYVETPEVTTHASGTILDYIKKKNPNTTSLQSILFLNQEKIEQIKAKTDPSNPFYDKLFDRVASYLTKSFWPSVKNNTTVVYNYAMDWNADNWGISDVQTLQQILAYCLTGDMGYINRYWLEMSYDAVPGDTFDSKDIKHGYLIRNPERRLGYDEYTGAYVTALSYDWAYHALNNQQRTQLAQWILDKCCTYDYNSHHGADDFGTDASNHPDYTATPHTILDMHNVGWKDEIGNHIARARTALVVAVVTATIAENITCNIMNEQSQPAVRDGRTPAQIAERVIGMTLCAAKRCLNLFDPSGGFHAGFTYYQTNYLSLCEFIWIFREIFGIDIFDFYNHEDPKYGYPMPAERKIGQGKKDSVFYSLYMCFPTWSRGKFSGSFNYGDGTDDDITPIGSFYLGKTYAKEEHDPSYLAPMWRNAQLDWINEVWKTYTIPKYLIDHISVPDEYSPENQNLETSRLFKGKMTEVAAMISSWNEYYPAKAFMRGGGFIYDHTHWDRGNFVFFAKNIKWAIDLGYPNVFPTWGGGWWRFNSGKVTALNHNTVYLDNINQNRLYSPITMLGTNHLSINLQPTYYGHVQTMSREMELDGKNLIITDTVELNAPTKVTSQFLFYSKMDDCHIRVSADGKILKLKAKRIDDKEYEYYYVKIHTPVNATWDVSYMRLGVPERYYTFETNNGTEEPARGTPMRCKIVVPPSNNLNVEIKYEFMERL